MQEQSFEDVGEVIAKREISLNVGVILERRKSKHPWGDWVWRVVDVVPGARKPNGWTKIGEGDEWTHFHIDTQPLNLHRKETEALKLNIQSGNPELYVVLREREDEDDEPFEVHMVTASSYDAQDFADTSEEIVEKTPMPPAIFEWISAFVQEHHREEVFKKRKRDKLDVEEHKFGKDPIFVTGKR